MSGPVSYRKDDAIAVITNVHSPLLLTQTDSSRTDPTHTSPKLPASGATNASRGGGHVPDTRML